MGVARVIPLQTSRTESVIALLGNRRLRGETAAIAAAASAMLWMENNQTDQDLHAAS